MTDDLYERYKEALRVGHVAVLRGSLEGALDAYRTAADIAPSRALPHTSVGGVLLRLGRVDEALVEFAGAVARAPRDEGALLGQAEALAMAGKREDAARALDLVSELQAASGRLPEAADTLRRAIELSDTPHRADQQHEMLRQVRLSEGDQVAEQLLARALRLREAARPARSADALPQAAAAPEMPTEAAPEVGEATLEAKPEDDSAAEAAQPLIDAAAESAIDAAAEPALVSVDAVESVEPAAESMIEAPAEPALEPAAQADEPAVASAIEAAAEPAPEPAEPGVPETPDAPSLLTRLEGWDGWWGEEPAAPAAAARPASLEDELVDADVPLEVAPAQQLRPVDVADATTIEPEDADVEPSATAAQPEPAAESAPAAQAAPAAQPAPAAEPTPAAEAEPVTSLAQDELAADAQAADDAGSEPVGIMESAAEQAAPAPSGDELLAAAEAADLEGDVDNLRKLLLETARAYGRESRYEAAIDAATRVLQAWPSDLETHLALVELYMARDWAVLAVEKLALLARLTELSGDEEGRRRVCAVATASFPRDDRFDSVCS